jgi:hypothetical protein
MDRVKPHLDAMRWSPSKHGYPPIPWYGSLNRETTSHDREPDDLPAQSGRLD